jgi:hypothetical protein
MSSSEAQLVQNHLDTQHQPQLILIQNINQMDHACQSPGGIDDWEMMYINYGHFQSSRGNFVFVC